MKIMDKTIFEALHLMRQNFKNNRDFADKLKISYPQCSRLLGGKISYISDDTWSKIEPMLEVYIKKVLSKKCLCPRATGCIFQHLIENLLDTPADEQQKYFSHLNEIILRHNKKNKNENKN